MNGQASPLKLSGCADAKPSRCLTPELLDDLPADAPAALRSRRDLRRLNAWMRHPSLLRQCLAPVLSKPVVNLAELGAGDGTLFHRVAQSAIASPPSTPEPHSKSISFLDKQPVIEPGTISALKSLGWRTQIIAADVFDWLSRPALPPLDAIFANLFLHHFSQDQLVTLLRQAAARTERFIALEPRRSRAALFFSRWVGLLGCGPVTRHDARVSVEAGFAEKELSALWPPGPEWRLEERPASVSTHLFIAERCRRHAP